MYSIRTTIRANQTHNECLEDTELCTWLTDNLGLYWNVDEIQELQKKKKLYVASYSHMPFITDLNDNDYNQILVGVFKETFNNQQFVDRITDVFNNEINLVRLTEKTLKNVSNTMSSMVAVFALMNKDSDRKIIRYVHININIIEKPYLFLLKKVHLDFAVSSYKMLINS